MNEMQWRVQDAQIHPNRIGGQKNENSVFESLSLPQENPMIADILDIKAMLGNPDISLKARSIEKHIQNTLLKEKEGKEGVGHEKEVYMNTLNKIAEEMSIPLQQLLKNKQGLKTLDLLFREVALFNKMSSKGYFVRMKVYLQEQRVKSNLQKLSLALAKL